MQCEGKVEFGVRIGIKGVMRDEVRIEGIWKLMKLELGFRLGVFGFRYLSWGQGCG